MIINNMPAGGGGGKVVYGTITDLSQLKTRAQSGAGNQSGTLYYIDEDYLGFKPDGYYAITKYVRYAEPYFYYFHVVHAVGYLNVNEAKTKVRVMSWDSNRYYTSPNSGQYNTDHDNYIQGTMGNVLSTFTPDERVVSLFVNSYETYRFDSVEFYAWAK